MKIKCGIWPSMSFKIIIIIFLKLTPKISKTFNLFTKFMQKQTLNPTKVDLKMKSYRPFSSTKILNDSKTTYFYLYKNN